MPKSPFGATPHDQGHVHLALPLGLVGFAGASFVSDYFRFGFTGQNELTRGMFTLILPLSGALLGLLLSSRPIARSRLHTWGAVLVGTIGAGAVIGAAVASSLWGRGELAEAAGVGAVTALVFLPFIALITRAARIAGRARRGSIVDEADRRAPWTIIASTIAVGRLLTSGAPPEGLVMDADQRLPSVCSALALLASIALLGFTLFDLVSLTRARRATTTIFDMSARDPFSGVPCDDTLDVGVGEEEHEELFGGPAYRTAVRPLRVIRGSPDRGVQLLRRAVIASAACCVLAWAVTIVAMTRPESASVQPSAHFASR